MTVRALINQLSECDMDEEIRIDVYNGIDGIEAICHDLFVDVYEGGVVICTVAD